MQLVIKKLDTRFATGSWPVPEVAPDHPAWDELDNIDIGRYIGSDDLNDAVVRVRITNGRAEIIVKK